MPITDFNSYKSKVVAPYQTLHSTKISITAITGRMYSLWPVNPDAGAVPTTAAVPINTTLGSLAQLNSAGVQRLAQIEGSSTFAGYWIVADRLSHQGGLSGIVTGAQTTNLPTAALTRYTSGEGVMMGLEIYTAIGTTATTITVSYTNSSGTSGRISEVIVFGGTNFREANRFIQVPLQEGDTGVRSVQSVNIVASTTTAGNFGVTLFKPLFVMPLLNAIGQSSQFDSILSMAGNMPKIESNACLQWLLNAGNNASGIWLSVIKLIEE